MFGMLVILLPLPVHMVYHLPPLEESPVFTLLSLWTAQELPIRHASDTFTAIFLSSSRKKRRLLRRLLCSQNYELLFLT